MARTKKAPEPSLWCTANVCGHHYTIQLGDAESCPDLHDSEGITYPEKTTIVIRDSMSPSRQDETLLHELCVHALFDASGAGHSLKASLGLSDDAWDAFEENLARLLAPALLSILHGNGWLNLPAKPRLAKARIARKVAKERR